MTRTQQLNAEAEVHEREAENLRRFAVRLASKGLVFSAADCSEQARKELAWAGHCRVLAINMEAE